MIAKEINWILWGIITGLCWGIFALFFYVPYPLKWSKRSEVARSILVLMFQFLFNFFGGFAGWLCMRLFLLRYWRDHFGFPELILLGIALFGISGRLAHVLYELPGALREKVEAYFPSDKEKANDTA